MQLATKCMQLIFLSSFTQNTSPNSYTYVCLWRDEIHKFLIYWWRYNSLYFLQINKGGYKELRAYVQNSYFSSSCQGCDVTFKIPWCLSFFYFLHYFPNIWFLFIGSCISFHALLFFSILHFSLENIASRL